MRKLQRTRCFLMGLGCLNAAMLLLGAAADEEEGQCALVGDFAGGPRLCVQDED